jgi:hypothetical protein
MKKLKFIKTSIIIGLFSLTFFFYYLNLINHGLPYFVNYDEIASLKSTLYFFGFFSHANQSMIEPFFAPLLNFLIGGFIIFLKNIFSFHLNLLDLQNYIYLNPDILIHSLRLSSLFSSTLCIFVTYFILDLFRINKLLKYLAILIIFTSPVFGDIAINVGKNSYLVLFFLIQLYFFIYYLLNIENFNLKSYILFGLLASMGWGINYWCATPGIYAIVILHSKKFKFTYLINLAFFLTTFFLFGLVLNYFLSIDTPIKHIFSENSFNLANFILRVLIKIKDGIIILFYFEKFTVVFFLITIFFYKLLNKTEKIIYITIFLLVFEPILIFAIAENARAQFRYFAPSFVIMQITIFWIFNKLLNQNHKYQNTLFSIFFLSLLISLYFRISVVYGYQKIINNKSTEYLSYEHSIKNNNNSIFLFSRVIMRESKENLYLYKDLIDKNILILNPEADNKNNSSEIIKKINIINKYENLKIYPNGKNFINLGGEFIIKDHKKLIDYLSKKYDYFIVDDRHVEIVNVLNNKFQLESKIDGSNLFAPRDYFTYHANTDLNKIKFIGPTMLIYNLKKFKNTI